MFSARLRSFAALAALLSLASGDPNSVCRSFGVDFVDDQHYFINSLSSEPFTCVSTFQGCNEDTADVLLVGPSGEFLCTQVPTTPENDPKLSTCPILKNQMVSGDWIIVVAGNNDDGFPFAWQRDISLDVGPQATVTSTPTVTFSVTETPVITATSTSTSTIVTTVGPFATTTIATATAKMTETVTPPGVKVTSTRTQTRTRITLTSTLITTTKTVTATCTTPKPGRPDKPCRYSPTLIHPEAIVTPTTQPVARLNRFVRKGDRAINYHYARSRIEAAKARRDAAADPAPAQVQERAPDAPTLTIPAETPASTTVTVTGPATTSTTFVDALITSTSTLPPRTIFSGIFTSTVTLPPRTTTRITFVSTTISSTQTVSATYTTTKTITPSAAVTACKKVGGHIGPLLRM